MKLIKGTAEEQQNNMKKVKKKKFKEVNRDAKDKMWRQKKMGF